MSKQATPAQHFEPPGPGSWNLDPVHFPRPVTRYWSEMHPEPFRRGTSEFMGYYGALIESMETQYVNGFAYNAMHPVSEDEVPRRFARAEVVWDQKVWREQLREWDETAKPAAIKVHRELQSVDVSGLSDEGLVAYLTRCREHHGRMIYQHMRFTGSAMLPVGDLLAHVGTWTSVASSDVLAMMLGLVRSQPVRPGLCRATGSWRSQGTLPPAPSSTRPANRARSSQNCPHLAGTSARPRRAIWTSSGVDFLMASTFPGDMRSSCPMSCSVRHPRSCR